MINYNISNLNKNALTPTRTCTNCVMDDTDPLITFDENGLCNHCREYPSRLKMFVPEGEEKKNHLVEMVSFCKKAGKGKKYDCVIGVSGGVDSTYVAYLVKSFGLRPLAVHLDNGWNAELAVSNIKGVLAKLDIDLYTHVLNWDEFKNLQLAFLRASTPDSEIPSDHAIVALMREIAHKEGVPVIWGVNFTSESILPRTWSQGHMDWAYIKKVNKLYGKGRLSNYPHYSVWKLIYYRRITRQRLFNVLNFINYNKEEAKKFLMQELGFRDYGGKHHESIYTRIFQTYILPVKFGFDKRKCHYSSLILSNQMTREQALKELEKPPYDPSTIDKDIEYLCKKFDLGSEDFEAILKASINTYEKITPRWTSKVKRIDAASFSLLKRIRKIFK
jgi:N-acetyl sugar amidotransferase